jgi:hypothetical protein
LAEKHKLFAWRKFETGKLLQKYGPGEIKRVEHSRGTFLTCGSEKSNTTLAGDRDES